MHNYTIAGQLAGVARTRRGRVRHYFHDYEALFALDPEAIAHLLTQLILVQ